MPNEKWKMDYSSIINYIDYFYNITYDGIKFTARGLYKYR